MQYLYLQQLLGLNCNYVYITNTIYITCITMLPKFEHGKLMELRITTGGYLLMYINGAIAIQFESPFRYHTSTHPWGMKL